jgi:hypothetical protein
VSILENIPYTDERVARQLHIEELIVQFKPDPYEASEILDALLKNLRDEEIDHYATSLQKSLNRYEDRNADPLEVDEIDAFKLDRARKAGL